MPTINDIPREEIGEIERIARCCDNEVSSMSMTRDWPPHYFEAAIQYVESNYPASKVELRLDGAMKVDYREKILGFLRDRRKEAIQFQIWKEAAEKANSRHFEMMESNRKSQEEAKKYNSRSIFLVILGMIVSIGIFFAGKFTK